MLLTHPVVGSTGYARGCLSRKIAAPLKQHPVAGTCRRELPDTRKHWTCDSSSSVAFPETSSRDLQSAPSTSTIQHHRHITQDGLRLEVLTAKPQGRVVDRPPLLFVHGSYHAAWCWAEKFMPWFQARGYACHAVSMRAQGRSDGPSSSSNNGKQPTSAGLLTTHTSDLAHYVQHEFLDKGLPGPVIVAHSFGGILLQKYVLGIAKPGAKADPSRATQFGHYPQLSGVAYLASLPPSNKEMGIRFIKRDPMHALKFMWHSMTRSVVSHPDTVGPLYFSHDIPRAELVKYQKQMATSSHLRLVDMMDISKSMPLPPPPAHAPPAFVLGGEDDKVVDTQAIEELASFYHVDPVILPGMAHDVALDTRWDQAAQSLELWLRTLQVKVR